MPPRVVIARPALGGRPKDTPSNILASRWVRVSLAPRKEIYLSNRQGVSPSSTHGHTNAREVHHFLHVPRPAPMQKLRIRSYTKPTLTQTLSIHIFPEPTRFGKQQDRACRGPTSCEKSSDKGLTSTKLHRNHQNQPSSSLNSLRKGRDQHLFVRHIYGFLLILRKSGTLSHHFSMRQGRVVSSFALKRPRPAHVMP